MRITAEAKGATRQRILDAAMKLFGTQGYDATTTRDIAQAAEIATGTLFNYFAAKEAIVAALAGELLSESRKSNAPEVPGRPGGMPPQQVGDSLSEDLFALVAAELRRLRPLRKYILPLLETALSPLAAAHRREADDELRLSHLEAATGMARRHGIADLSPTALQLYWTLYTGVLAFWAADKSPKQEDTLALLDQSLTMFVGWLSGETGGSS